MINSFYSSTAAEKFFQLKHNVKSLLLTCLETSNFSAVDPELIHKIAKNLYDQKILNISRLKILPFHELKEIKKENSLLALKFNNKLLNKTEIFNADGVCLATGYSNNHLPLVLKNFYPYFETDENNIYKVNVNYRVESKKELSAGIYLQGYARASHGFTEGTIADLSGRSQSILQDIFNVSLKLNQIKCSKFEDRLSA